MNRDGHNNVTFFVGGEVEHTPAFSKKTLFVVGEQELATIEKHARDNKTPHIFMGANHSFDALSLKSAKYWDATITALLDKGFMVTLDYEAHMHSSVLDILNPGVWQSRLFVPLLGVRIPKIETSNPNLTVKIDDIDFAATNRGVWCMHFHEVTDSNRFTGWQDYETDSVIHADVSPVEVAVEKIAKIELNLPEPEIQTVLNDISEVKNSIDLGLDVKPTTALKADVNQPIIADITATIEDAAAAYAEGAKADPLGKEASAKPAKGKK